MKKVLSLVLTVMMITVVGITAGFSAVASSLVAVPLHFLGQMAFSGFGPGFAFASIISGEPITFNGKEATEGIILPAFEKPALSLFHTILQDIVAGEQVAFLPRINKITRLDAGCGTGIQSKALTPTEKNWAPKKLKIWLQQCADDLEATFFVWGLNKGIARKDLTNTDFLDYILEIMPDGIMEDALRIAWLGDTAENVFGSGGHLLAAGDVPDYTQLTGFWAKMIAGVVGTTIQRVTISENGNATFALQALASGKALTVFKGLLTGNTDSRLKSAPDKIILCTTSLFENWLEYKESLAIDSSFVRQDKGFQTDTYRGVTIIAVDLWDRYLQADFQDGTKWYLPHRAVLTTKSNLQIGLDTAGITELKSYLDDTTELHNIKGGYKMDVQIPYDFMCKVAY